MGVQKLMVRNCSLLGCDVESYHWASKQHLKEMWCLHLQDHAVQDNIGTLKWVLNYTASHSK